MYITCIFAFVHHHVIVCVFVETEEEEEATEEAGTGTISSQRGSKITKHVT